jgi:hypothetical protein
MTKKTKTKKQKRNRSQHLPYLTFLFNY